MIIHFDKYLITPLFLVLIMTAIVGVWMSVFLFKRRKTRSVIFLSIWTFAAAIWSFTYAFEYGATDVLLKIFWSKLSYFGIVFCPISFFFFTIAYSSRLRYLKPKYIISTYIIASLFILEVLTNDYHHLHWRTVSIYTDTNTTEYTYGILFWLFYAFTYFFLFSGVINLYMLYFKFPERYKSQIGIFLIATFFPIAGNLSYVFNINPIPGFDWTPLMFMISAILLSVNIFRFGIFDLVPFARNKIFDMMPDAVMIIDNEFRIADLNPSMEPLIGKKEKEIIGKKVQDIFPQWKHLIDPGRKEKANNVDVAQEINGKVRYFTYQSTPIFDNKGHFSGKFMNIRDVTEHKEAENEVEKAYKQLKEESIEKEKLIVDLDAFAHTVAHDLKNMLGAIVTSANLLKMSLKDGNKEETNEILELIELSSRKTLHTTQELLLLASVRQREIKKEILDMSEIIKEGISRNFNLVKEHKVQFITPDYFIPSVGYSSWIEEVWFNYVNNAIKYGGNPPVIEFGSEDMKNGMIKYWIKDNGNGIPKKQQGMLFNKFTRLENLKIEGHGLGLSIVKRIVEKLDGTVGLESTGRPGEGTIFYFLLPAR